MPEIGQSLSHYSIVEKIGKGGMGEVYRAKDQKLGRDVAIKVLPEEFARDADRVARFQREAKLLASLNHTNIASIYGLEESGGMQFLVLELVEGDTLADQIKRGPIPVEESLKLALQIAEALEAAHEKGVIHRDLKPANIKVTPEGKVKVLDFGLAKAFAGDQTQVNLSNSPTLSDMATQQGVILGTAAYMSPEQARGKPVDKRTDIWAFGCVLFEMLTGRAAFSGGDVTEILAAVIRAEPEWKNLPAHLHWRLREVLERCLEKEAKDRYGGINDARFEIQKALADPRGILVQPALEPRTKLRTIFPWLVAAVAVTAIIAGAAVWNLKKPEPQQVTRFFHELPGDQRGNLIERIFSLSPDGRQFVYVTNKGLFLRSLDQLDARLLAGTEGATQPFFSPDGKWIGYRFAADNQLRKIAIGGGASVALTKTVVLGNITWGADGMIVYGQSGSGIMGVSAGGGAPEAIVSVENEIFVSPQILPDGKSILFTRLDAAPYSIMVQSIQTGERKQLLEGDTARYLPTGHILYAFGNDLFAVPFDLNKLELKGGPVLVVEGVYRNFYTAPQYAVSDSGTLIYSPGTTSAAAPDQRILVWVDRNGKEEMIAAPPNGYAFLKISPDGRRVALAVNRTSIRSDIWIWDLTYKTLTRLTDTLDGWANVPLWTPDGKRIAFMLSRQGSPSGIYIKAADGTGTSEPLSASRARLFPWSWADKGKVLVLEENIAGSISNDIGMLLMEGEHKWKPLLREKYSERQPQVSPDGRWMAYTSNESGKNEVYIRPFPEVDRGGRWQVSASGGQSPLWSPDGRELFYRNEDAVMAVSVKTDPGFSLKTAKILFRRAYFSPGPIEDVGSPWDISPDGKQFLMIKESESATLTGEQPRKINIVLNWFEELKQRVPTK